MKLFSVQPHTYRSTLLILVFVVAAFLIQFSFAHAQQIAPSPADVNLSAFGNAAAGVLGQVTEAVGWLADELLFKPLAWLIYGLSLMIGGLFLGLGGLTLDIALRELVVGMGEFFGGGFGAGVIDMWEIIRDILNIVFIYSFIYLGIKTILNSENSSTQKSLGLLIVAALFINFSLFITSTIIDFSNIAATQIYNEILSLDEVTLRPTGVAVEGGSLNVNLGSRSISGAFLDVANITSWFGGNSTLYSSLSSIQIVVFSLFLLIFFIFAGFVFFISAIRLIYRFIALSLYMIFSPVMFLGLILPNFASKSSEWWNGLLKNAFFAPAFLFLIYLSLNLLEGLKTGLGMGDDASYATLFTAGGSMQADGFTIFIFFAMMIGFLYASVKVGEMMSVAGSKTTMKIFNGAIKSARGAVQGAAYRGTIGAGLNKIVGGMDALDRAAENNDGKGLLAKMRRGGARGLRSAIGGESTRKAAEKASNYGAGGLGRADVEKMNKERAKRVSTGNAAIALRTKIKAGVNAAAGPLGNQARIEMENELAGASIPDLVKLAQSEEGFALLKKIAGNLPEKKFESLMDNDDLTPQQKADLGKGRKESINENLMSAGTDPTLSGQLPADKLRKGIMGATAEQLNAMEFKELMDPENIIYTQSAQLDKLESKWGDEKMRIFKEVRKKAIIDKASASQPGMREILESRKGEKEIAKLPKEIFTNSTAFLINELQSSGRINGGFLHSVASESSMSGSEKKAFGGAIKATFPTAVGGLPSLPSDIDGFFKSAQGGPFN